MAIKNAPKTKSIARFAKSQTTKDTAAREKARSSATADSFVNFAQSLGVGASGPLSTASYGYNPITRNRPLLEWIHRGSWLGGVAIDIVADDMTREGVELNGPVAPDDLEHLEERATALGIWNSLNETIKWSRLYGGCIAVMLIDGQDPETPLRLDSIARDQFCGLLVLDRWMIEPSLNNLVTAYGPDLGQPKFYRVTSNAPALPRMNIHHSRCIRLGGIPLPYWQRVTENLWGLSVIERLYDRMIAFDSASTGAAQLVYKAYVRTYKIKDLRDIIAAGGEAQAGLIAYVEMMRKFQGNEGITLLDSEDAFSGESHGAFSGLSDALQQFGQQLAGALQIPLVRLFGQSPAGFSSGDSDLRQYYDGIKQQQEKDLRVGVTNIYRALAASEGIDLSKGFSVSFKSLWQLTDEQKSSITSTTAPVIIQAEESGLIDRTTALKELRQLSSITGVFSNISDEAIEEAETEGPPDPEGEDLSAQLEDLTLDAYTGPKFAIIKALSENEWDVTSSSGERIGTYPSSEMAKRVSANLEKGWM